MRFHRPAVLLVLLALAASVVAGEEARLPIPESPAPAALSRAIWYSGVDRAVVVARRLDVDAWSWVPPSSVAPGREGLIGWCSDQGFAVTGQEPVLEIALTPLEAGDRRILESAVAVTGPAPLPEVLGGMAAELARKLGVDVEVELHGGPRDPFPMRELRPDETLFGDVPWTAELSLVGLARRLAAERGGIWRIAIEQPQADLTVIHIAALTGLPFPDPPAADPWPGYWGEGAIPEGVTISAWLARTLRTFAGRFVAQPAEAIAALRREPVRRGLWSGSILAQVLLKDLIALGDPQVLAALAEGLDALPPEQRKPAVLRLPSPDEVGPRTRPALVAWWQRLAEDRDPDIASCARLALALPSP